MKGKYVKLSNKDLIFLVVDKVTYAVASGTNEYVNNEKFIVMNQFGKLFEIYHTEMDTVLALSDVPKEVLQDFQKFNYRH